MMHSAALHNGSMYVFGGIEPGNVISNTLVALDLDIWCWRDVSSFDVEGQPMKMAGHVSAATDGQILVFGGMNLESMQLYSNVFAFSIEEA